MARTKIRTEDITDSEVTTAKMATDPTNASNLSSGSVPLAQLGNVDTTGLEDDIAILGFKVAANGSLAKYDLVDQTVDDFQSEAGIDTSASTNEGYNSSGKYYSGAVVGSYSVSAFTSTGASTWTCPANTTEAEVLIVAGGGGGANGYYGGAGGAGGVVHDEDYTVVPTTVYDLSVGAGGSGGNPTAGTNSVWNVNAEGSGITMTALGGGRGGGGGGSSHGGDGGSGGGADNDASSPGGSGTQTSPTGAVGYGNDGGGTDNAAGGGGGGAAAAGEVGSGGGSNYGGDGGAGKLFSNFTAYGTTSGNVASSGSDGGYFAGGGGGAAYNNVAPGGAAGVGGGGRGQGNDGGTAAGIANTGGGGGAGSVQGSSGSAGQPGGSGVILIRHRALSYNNMTLISNSTTAEAVPTKGDLVMTYTDGAGTNTINTDIKGYVSRDNGTTYTQGTLVDQGTTGGHTILSFHDLDISGQPSGSAMRYKIETLNQAEAKYANIQAVSLGWS